MFRSSLTVSQIRARLLKFVLLKSDRNKLEVPILMTCATQSQCRKKLIGMNKASA